MSSSPVSPGEEFRRDHPLSPPDEVLSQASPSNYFSSFAFPGSSENSPSKPSSQESRYARLAHARRRASHIQTRMTTTASQVWSRAIARARGSVSLTASFRDIAIILPHVNLPTRPSHPGIADLTLPPSNGYTRKQSNRDSRPCSLPSLGSYQISGANDTAPRYALPSRDGGFEKLLTVEGESRAKFGLGFGPKKGLLGEDTLRARLDVGRLHTSLDASDKLQELAAEQHTRREKSNGVPEGRGWGPRSMPRVRVIQRWRAMLRISRSCCEPSNLLRYPFLMSRSPTTCPIQILASYWQARHLPISHWPRPQTTTASPSLSISPKYPATFPPQTRLITIVLEMPSGRIPALNQRSGESDLACNGAASPFNAWLPVKPAMIRLNCSPSAKLNSMVYLLGAQQDGPGRSCSLRRIRISLLSLQKGQWLRLT